ncbi:MAG: hypothetical protein CVV44_19590 [Spirochaetae bacterium HGW-Spirochaetae-1]|jgi:hypothetical protein|nr:MAG: hypothetical protein CVV44_19590 [Spirochaetae bacterium HGW-Spirochaetae-1]
MADVIKTITDREHFPHIFNTYFAGNEVYLRTKNGNLLLQFLGISNDHVAFRIPSVKNIPDTITVQTRHGTNTIYASLKFFEKNEDTFVFVPVKIQVVAESRKEDRKLVGDDGGGKTVLYIYDIISDTVIQNAISMQSKKVEKIIEIAEFELKKKFENVRINFIAAGINDSRLKYILATRKYIYIPDLNSQPPPDQEEAFNNYLNTIYKKDFQLNRGHKYVSEATVPIMFRKLIPYGYIQVNNSSAMSDGIFEVVKRMAIIVDQLFIKNTIFTPINAKFLVSDISRSGLGIVFKDRRLTGYFRKGSTISFETMLPTQKRAVIGAVIRNITFMEGGVIKVGMEVNQMDKTSWANVEEYLDQAGI